MFKNIALPLQNAISLIATTIIALALIVLLSHYVAAVFQPVRWPTRYYFFGMFLIAFFCKQRTAVMLFVFSLPILPDFHLQLEAVLKPSVKYFVGHPGLDVVAGLCLGLWAKRVWRTKRVEPLFEQVNWVLGLLVISLAVSVSIAVVRNLQVASLLDINPSELFTQLVQFKLMNYPNNYLPIVDLLSYSFAILVICVLTPILRAFDAQQRDEVIFRPLIWSLIFSAAWGIFQALTGMGLFQVTLDYRQASFGYGAQGFQPDIHAFAALMLIGTVGLFSFIKKAQRSDILLGYACIALCWIALILSKSKATFVFAVMASLIVMLFTLRSRGFSVKKISCLILLATAGLAFVLFITKNFVWIEHLAQLLAPDNLSRENFNKAFVYRPELFRAALYMFIDSPIFGVGQGNFFRLSSNLDISHSLYMAQKGGDNAHNYFLQTLAEVGLIGSLTFILAIVWPFFRIDPPSKIAAPALVILAIALGNLFSHPLLVRPNLILFSVFLALMYSYVETSSKNHAPLSTA
jgi:O-antigen ligase